MDPDDPVQRVPEAEPGTNEAPRGGRPPQVPRLQLQLQLQPLHHSTAAPSLGSVSEVAAVEHRSASAPVSEGSLTHRSASEYGGGGPSTSSVASTAVRRGCYIGEYTLNPPRSILCNGALQ